MDALVEGLMEELNCETVFTIPLFGGIPVYESVVVTWIIMAVVFLLCILLSRNLSVENPSRRQVVVETAIKGLNDFFTETVGEKGKAYIPYLSAIAIYIGIANLIGLLGFKPPTKDMNVTATLALMSIVLIEVAGIRARGTKGWLKSFAEPMPIILPINILEVFIKPLSLCMRLFGNVLGSRGSVVPVFKDQIAKGGPLTVTDFRMTRYFMTIPEASRLVIQAGYLALGGEIFVLDMGDPVRIVDLAKKVIKLSGHTVSEIGIVESGIRPGEKLYEELMSTSERVSKKIHEKIFVGKVGPKSMAEVEGFIKELLALDNQTLKERLIEFAKQE